MSKNRFRKSQIFHFYNSYHIPSLPPQFPSQLSPIRLNKISPSWFDLVSNLPSVSRNRLSVPFRVCKTDEHHFLSVPRNHKTSWVQSCHLNTHTNPNPNPNSTVSVHVPRASCSCPVGSHPLPAPIIVSVSAGVAPTASTNSRTGTLPAKEPPRVWHSSLITLSGLKRANHGGKKANNKKHPLCESTCDRAKELPERNLFHRTRQH